MGSTMQMMIGRLEAGGPKVSTAMQWDGLEGGGDQGYSQARPARSKDEKDLLFLKV